MHRHLLFILTVLFTATLTAANETIAIPLHMTVFRYLPQDGPTGSTPDPTDPNQFRASLTGNTLFIETQAGQVSYVVVQETQSERQNEDYFYELSFDSVSCPITHAGLYTIHIGCWKTDFTGQLLVKRMYITDINGHLWGETLDPVSPLPSGYYIIRLETNLGNTAKKFYQL